MTDSFLRKLGENDLEQVLAWRNSDHIKQYMYTDKEITWQEHVQWYEKVSTDPHHDVFIYVQHDQPLGLVQFFDKQKQHQRCYWGFYIGELDAPKGSGTKMASLAFTHIFSQGMRKVCAEVIETNQPSFHFHQKLGFKLEGTLRQHVMKNRQYYDVWTLGLLKEEWKGGIS
ncbi:UDP-4-amino-4,6-dideoxy-N-acetyl-beta-L-altrosamine N-acetyltransferase [Gracilibacillus thailandensis]|uniref:UDP-4-amino-4, 6-dideoxy-N-acetyl-beta-L-altrosamine N-acetyltransferase n=1 Tax=Gracilibacillus thailandensis TaxID=563735 RepID=A0A6N7QT80_9BACI|nr:UDP-4-amino-4,6-dideoxy-N-acetyl-beta-L-altrosamine N-acetyltransferase [Gracilibacillus thailandensis]MRI65327.1 UDP-4-amino-4,6-dideoxy-N-acetyl-beta-L-altrosamine N-acetyltransferase [Gracilibacillus thailandensis]